MRVKTSGHQGSIWIPEVKRLWGRVSEDKALRNPDHWGPQEREVTITKCNRHNRKKLNSTAIREQGSFEKRLKRSYSSPRPFEQLKAETGLTGPANE